MEMHFGQIASESAIAHTLPGFMMHEFVEKNKTKVVQGNCLIHEWRKQGIVAPLYYLKMNNFDFCKRVNESLFVRVQYLKSTSFLFFNEFRDNFSQQAQTRPRASPPLSNVLLASFRQNGSVVDCLSPNMKYENNVGRTFGHKTYFPKCLRENYLKQFQHQSTGFMHLYQERMAYIQIEERRYYFVPQQYQFRMISLKLETNPQDLNQWNQRILLHNEDNKIKAEDTGFLSIDLSTFTFTRKENTKNISIVSEFFKEVSLQGTQIDIPQKQQVLMDKIEQRKIIKRECSIFRSISEASILNLAGQTQAQKNLIEQITLQTVYIAERKYHMYLINFLLRSIDDTNKKKKIVSAFFNKQITSKAKTIEDQEKKRLLRELEEMKQHCQQIKFDKQASLEFIQNEHSRVYSQLYIEQFKLAAEKSIISHFADTKTRIEEIKQLFKDVTQCIGFLKKMKGLRGGGGVSFQTMLQSLGAVCQEYIGAMQSNLTMNTQMVSAQISLNPTGSLINLQTPFESMKYLLQGRSASISAFLNCQSFKTPDDKFLQQPLPVKDLNFLKLLSQDNINSINQEALVLLKASISEIIYSRVEKQQIEKKVNEAFEYSGLAQIYRRWNEQPSQLNSYKEKIKYSVRSKMGSDIFGKKCEQFFVGKLQMYHIFVELSKQDNIKSIQKEIMKIKEEFMKSSDYQIKWQDRIEAYHPPFNSLQSTFRSFYYRVYTNIDRAYYYYKVGWTPCTSPPCETLYNYNFNIELKGSTISLKSLYLDKFIINDKGKIITEIAKLPDLELSINFLNRSIQQSEDRFKALENQSKKVKMQALQKQLLKDLVEDYKQEIMYQTTINRQRVTISIPGIGQLTPDQKVRIQRTFNEQILPRLETGNIIVKCQTEITQILKGIKEDELTFSKIQVDQKFHKDTINDQTIRIKQFERWIKDASDLENQFSKLSEQYQLIQKEELQKKQCQVYSLELAKQVYLKNARLQEFMIKLKAYNKKTTAKLKEAVYIDKGLFEMGLNKIKIPFFQEVIQEICSDVRVKANQLMNIVVERRVGQQDAIQDLQTSLQSLNELQLNNIAGQMADIDDKMDNFRARIRLAMQGNELSPYQLRAFETSLQTVKTKVYQMKALNKFIDPR